MSKKRKSVSLKIGGQIREAWVATAGHFYECGPSGARILKLHGNDELRVSVSENELRSILEKIRELLRSNMYGGEIARGLILLEEYMENEYKRQIRGKV